MRSDESHYFICIQPQMARLSVIWGVIQADIHATNGETNLSSYGGVCRIIAFVADLHVDTLHVDKF